MIEEGAEDELQERLEQHVRHMSHLLGGAHHEARAGDEDPQENINFDTVRLMEFVLDDEQTNKTAVETHDETLRTCMGIRNN
jgi:hypothetical protein